MKNIYCSFFYLLLLVGVTHLNAQNFSEQSKAFEHLFEINNQWSKHSSAAPNITLSFNSDNDRIRFHLKTVIRHLSNNTPEFITGNTLKKRTRLLNSLEQYANNKIFPINIYHEKRQPYFIDHLGTHCAVGHLMEASENDELAQIISREYNFDYLKDIKTEGVEEWANNNGFLLDELAWIQPGYAPKDYMRNILKGTDGPIYHTIIDQFNDRLIFSGSFNKVNDKPCLNLGYYKNDQMGCFGDGIRGSIQDVQIISGAIYVGGQLHNNGLTYPIAFFKNNVWTYLSIPNRDNAKLSAFWMNGYDKANMEVIIEDPNNSAQQELWVWTKKTNKWSRLITFNGVVKDIESTMLGQCYAGHFNSIIIKNSTTTDTINVNNVVLYDKRAHQQWFGLGTEISDTVNRVLGLGNVIYFGGTCESNTKNDDKRICLSRYINGSLRPLIKSEQFMYFKRDTNIQFNITDLLQDEQSLLIAGDFKVVPNIGTYGSNFARYNLLDNSISSLANFDKPVYTIEKLRNTIYLGGAFENNIGRELYHLVKFDHLLNLTVAHQKSRKIIYPNPAKEIINIKGPKKNYNFEIFTLNGEIVKKGMSLNNKIRIQSLPKGTYILHLKHQKEDYQTKFVKM